MDSIVYGHIILGCADVLGVEWIVRVHFGWLCGREEVTGSKTNVLRIVRQRGPKRFLPRAAIQKMLMLQGPRASPLIYFVNLNQSIGVINAMPRDLYFEKTSEVIHQKIFKDFAFRPVSKAP